MCHQLAVRAFGNDIGKGAATIDPDLPFFHCLLFSIGFELYL